MQVVMIGFGRNDLWMPLFLNGILALVRCRFLGKFTGKDTNAGLYAVYLGISYICIFGTVGLRLPEFTAGILFFCMTFCFVCFGLKRTGAFSLLSVMLIYVVEQAGSGMLEPFNHLVIRSGMFLDESRVRIFMFGGYMLLIALIALLYGIINWKTKLKSAEFDRYYWIILMPVLMLFFFYSLSAETGMSDMTSVFDGNRLAFYYSTTPLKEALIFLVSAAEYTSVLLILFAYQKLTSAIRKEQERFLLRRQLAVQKQYIREAGEKIEQTRALRHDFQNHLAVVGGLLKAGRVGEAEEYLEKLKAAAGRLAFPCRTGNHTLDALLEDKLGAAGRLKIRVECDVTAPGEGMADDFDLCIIFANAFDNALKACCETDEEKRFIRLKTERTGDFYRIEVINSMKTDAQESVNRSVNQSANQTVEPGTGISNMRAVAEKYNGALTAEKKDGCFFLNVLLILSEQFGGISKQTG